MFAPCTISCEDAFQLTEGSETLVVWYIVVVLVLNVVVKVVVRDVIVEVRDVVVVVVV